MERLYLSATLKAEILAYVMKVLPEEACGFLGGRGEQVEVVLPVTNQLHSRSRFFMEPVELLQRLHWLDDHGLDILAIYHSHPDGPESPSATDIAEFNYPGSAELICFPREAVWEVRAFMIEGSSSREIVLITASDA